MSAAPAHGLPIASAGVLVETDAKLGWATGFLLTALIIVLIKVWLGMMIVKNHILREIKRVELQVARLERRPAS